MPQTEKAATAARGGLWRHAGFRNLWAGQTASMFGENIFEVAFVVIAAILLHATLIEMGLLSAIGYLPYLLMSLFVGAWLDSRPKRPVIVISDLSRAGLLMLIPIAWWTHELTVPVLMGISLLVGVCNVVSDIGGTSILPAVIERADLVEGNSKLELSSSVSSTTGNALGGTIVQVLTAPVAVIINAALYAVSALFTLAVKVNEPRREPGESGRRLWADIGEGVRFVYQNPTIRTMTLATLVANFFTMALEPVFLIYIARTLHLAPLYIGLILSASGVGAFIGAATSARISRLLPLGRLLTATSIVVGLAALIVPVATYTSKPAAVVLLIFMHLIDGVAVIACNVNLRSYRTAITPDAMQGRMTASIRLVVVGLSPIGSIVGGLIGTWAGVQTALVIIALGILSAAGIIGFSPIRKVERIPESHPESGPAETSQAVADGSAQCPAEDDGSPASVRSDVGSRSEADVS
jgi:MFS family permease